MTLRSLLGQALRESRGGLARLAFSAGCLAVGIAAVVAVAGLAEGLDESLRREAKKLLAADLTVQGRRALPEAVDAALAAIDGAVITRVRATSTMAATPPAADGTPGRTRLVELEAIDGIFPLYGELLLRPDRPLAELLADGGIVVGPELLDRLELAIGDPLRIGTSTLTITATVEKAPDRLGDAFSIGPRVLVSAATLDAAGILGTGSRVRHRALVRLPGNPSAESVRAVVAELEATLADSPFYRVESYAEAQPALRASLRRIERFLGLVALLSLMIGGMGVATATRAWLDSRIGSIAIRKCLGMRPREVLSLYLLQTALLGLAGSVVGTLAGLGITQLVPALVGGDLIPAGAVRLWQPLAVLRGVALGVGVAVVFSLPPLVGVLEVPALRALRASAEPTRTPRRWVVASRLAIGIGIAAFAAVQARSWLLGVTFALGLGVAIGAMAFAVLRIRTLLGRARGLLQAPRLGYALATLARPAVDTLGSAVALATGLLVLVALALVSAQLRGELAATLPRDAPTAFLIDIRPDQLASVQELLERSGADELRTAPVVMARLATIDGTSIADLAGAVGVDRERRWALTREQRLTYGAKLSADNQVVAGTLWSDPERAEVSVEEEFAADLGIAVGSTLELDVQGVPVELAVTSLRRVEWRSFDINFFLHVEPGVLDEAPQQFLAAARLPTGREQGVQDQLVASHPNVLMIPIREVLDRVLGVLERLDTGVRFLGGFTVVAGLGILAGALSAVANRRGREVALLGTLGATRGGIVTRFALEYALLGALVGVLGAGFGTILGWAAATRAMELEWTWRPGFALAVIAATIVATAVVGVAASAGALSTSPMAVLRGADSGG